MALSFACPSCKGINVVRVTTPGDTVTCASCGEIVAVPADAGEVTVSEPAYIAAQRAGTPARESASTGPGSFASPPFPIAIDAKLYSVGSVALASFLGGPLAGGILLAKNFNRFGQPAQRRSVLLWSALGTIGLLAVAMVIPDDIHIPRTMFIWPQI